MAALDTPQRLIDGLGLASVVRFTASEPDLGWLEKLDAVQSLARHAEAVEIRSTGPVLALVASELVAADGMVGEGREQLDGLSNPQPAWQRGVLQL